MKIHRIPTFYGVPKIAKLRMLRKKSGLTMVCGRYNTLPSGYVKIAIENGDL